MSKYRIAANFTNPYSRGFVEVTVLHCGFTGGIVSIDAFSTELGADYAIARIAGIQAREDLPLDPSSDQCMQRLNNRFEIDQTGMSVN